ncbi:hypothetical protein C7Y66_17930 [Chroococcidiopsis sp. CCALA 051]|uniref:DUF3102 domain-containing protein n=1 Tax=Chroococcidiopsis sp. CCALA 051 TaxID=869949 RepID=UPI000D0D29AB|nr:DUF3102 domain-containing protein [Chroococcidiopsis sp. CCALA 051]PSM47800.1 hypothetical protein C7Y66_17930 [Chroococcidiopsis sp. CCALA 051]
MNRMPVSVIDAARKEFNYTELEAEISQFVRQQTGEIQALVKRTAQDIIEIGQKLNAVKDKLKHGRFIDWIEAEFHWSYPTAARFMQVADRFGNQIYQIDKFAPSAMYELAAPSTSKQAIEEAIALAASGESITYSKAKALKKKYKVSSAKPKLEAQSTVSETDPSSHQAVSAQTSLLSPQVEIVETKPNTVARLSPNQASRNRKSPTSQPEVCWHLAKDHILYCDEPNSPALRQRLPEKLKLLLAFPPVPNWQTDIPADTRIIATRYLPKGKNSELLENTLEALLDLYTEVGETVAICYLPFPKILDVLNRFERRGILVEPDRQQVHEIVSYWKKGWKKGETKVKEVSL